MPASLLSQRFTYQTLCPFLSYCFADVAIAVLSCFTVTPWYATCSLYSIVEYAVQFGCFCQLSTAPTTRYLLLYLTPLLVRAMKSDNQISLLNLFISKFLFSCRVTYFCQEHTRYHIICQVRTVSSGAWSSSVPLVHACHLYCRFNFVLLVCIFISLAFLSCFSSVCASFLLCFCFTHTSFR